MATRKNPTALQIGQRIKQARRMAGFETASQLLETIPEWGSSRLGNYEAGISLPSPDDIRVIAKATGASPCWIMFGIGPIRPTGRDAQAIRHQNLTAVVEGCKATRGRLPRLLTALGLSRRKIDQYLSNPFLEIPDRIARRCEQFLKRPKGWIDEQHIEDDPVCAAFPDDMRRIMEVYSNLQPDQRRILRRVAEAFVEESATTADHRVSPPTA